MKIFPDFIFKNFPGFFFSFFWILFLKIFLDSTSSPVVVTLLEIKRRKTFYFIKKVHLSETIKKNAISCLHKIFLYFTNRFMTFKDFFSCLNIFAAKHSNDFISLTLTGLQQTRDGLTAKVNSSSPRKIRFYFFFMPSSKWVEGERKNKKIG